MSFFGFAEQVISAATSGGGGGSSDEPRNDVRKTGGQEYNAPHQGQRPQGSYDTEEVLSHAQGDDGGDNQGYIKKAIQHVHDNPDQHQQEVQQSDLSTYGPLIMKALTSASGSSSGFSVSSLLSGGLGSGGGNQIMGLVLKEAGNSFTGGGAAEKQSFMSGAAMTLTKVVAQKQLSSFIGGSNSGGLGMLSSLIG